jgi:hypothetical protein
MPDGDGPGEAEKGLFIAEVEPVGGVEDVDGLFVAVIRLTLFDDNRR